MALGTLIATHDGTAESLVARVTVPANYWHIDRTSIALPPLVTAFANGPRDRTYDRNLAKFAAALEPGFPKANTLNAAREIVSMLRDPDAPAKEARGLEIYITSTGQFTPGIRETRFMKSTCDLLRLTSGGAALFFVAESERVTLWDVRAALKTAGLSHLSAKRVRIILDAQSRPAN
jgi:hypothetical protein